MNPPIISLLIAFLVIVNVATANVQILPCRRCITPSECEEEPPQICVWGEGRDVCNRRICLKGPGEKCGGKFNILGICGDGMMCANSDNRCHGCFIPSMTCYPELND